MQKLKVHDSLSARGARAQALVNQLSAVLEGRVAGVDFGSEDAIPTVEVWVEGDRAFMTPALVVEVGRKIAQLSGAAVHFHEMRAQSALFFVFSSALLWEGDSFSERQKLEYGVPLESWASVLMPVPPAATAVPSELPPSPRYYSYCNCRDSEEHFLLRKCRAGY